MRRRRRRRRRRLFRPGEASRQSLLSSWPAPLCAAIREVGVQRPVCCRGSSPRRRGSASVSHQSPLLPWLPSVRARCVFISNDGQSERKSPDLLCCDLLCPLSSAEDRAGPRRPRRPRQSRRPATRPDPAPPAPRRSPAGTSCSAGDPASKPRLLQDVGGGHLRRIPPPMWDERRQRAANTLITNPRRRRTRSLKRSSLFSFSSLDFDNSNLRSMTSCESHAGERSPVFEASRPPPPPPPLFDQRLGCEFCRSESGSEAPRGPPFTPATGAGERM